ncbi:MAG: LPS export ABC transporter ATP-binding protein [Acidobacteria bacterium]|nr:LPS export ABC transporter ATP-binding protein [Acidobacteriota bacterium]MCG2815439.1 LPS export ABC transporter ATP-binding protein [Candidatus Aminicenantes bacterium]MBU1475520.1 LPS export ABC transporter ATP-binding protein [Acidobacteriota bacterium]MBU4202553.1 LPS export ABC transporter ATP-binding protein [Acidobacteriota bacterium]MBU4253078.1 LPS export ABC transporter ATP-binding protein [Acidobacteriota bacterium]
MKSNLEAVGLVKSYHRKCVVDDISLHVSRGEVVGLLGPNGAGKTTTFSLMLGLISRNAGRIYLNEEEITHLPMYTRARKGLCLLPQEPSVFRNLTVEENLLAIQETVRDSSREKKDAGRTIEEFGLAPLIKAKAYTLSGGERRRLEIVRALMTDPEFILLDEPFTGIDPLAIGDLQDMILSLKEKGLGLLITDHSVRETLKITDRSYIIDDGQILAEGTATELVNSDEVRRRYLGEDFDLD